MILRDASRRLVALGLMALLAIGLASCGSSSATAGPRETAASEEPLGVVAIGHSGLTGEGTGGQYEPVPENSWATGTSPDVNSVYLRLAAVRPETLGHVANTAQGGATADQLADQARAALRSVPHPALVIVSTIDNDIRCDGSDPQHIPEFGASVAAALTVVSAASPDSRILVVGQAGRPSPSYIKHLVAVHPSVKQELSDMGICSFFDRDGKLDPRNFATLTSIIDSYEAEEARVCATVPHCATDGGVRAAYRDTLKNFAPDLAHANVRGQAAAASLIWPVVASMLGV